MSKRTIAAFVAGVAVMAVVGSVFGGDGTGPAGAQSAVDLTTVEAQTRTMRTELGYVATVEVGTTETLTTTRSGTVTSSPEPGTTIAAGEAVARVDDEPVTLLYGDVPMYRELASGDVGADVLQLETFLAVAGHDAASPITVDESFTSATASALAAWQSAVGLEVDGVLATGTFVVAPGPVEVLEAAAVGDVLRDGTVLVSAASSALVTVDVTDGNARPLEPVTSPASPTVSLSVVPDEVDRFVVGEQVDVETADAAVHAGTIVDVGSVAVSDPQDATAEAGVSVTIEIDATTDVLAGSAEVRIIETERVDVVAVPTRALVALAEGGQAVEVADGEERRLVGVELGIYADGWVEITSDTAGGAVTSGTAIVVPA